MNWRAVIYGFVATLVVGFLSGTGLPFTDATLPTVGAGLTGIVGGLVAGYVAARGVGGGALHGIVATTLGAIVVGLVLVLLGTLASGFLGLVGLLGLLVYVLVAGIPGAVGGALGGLLARRTDVDRARPAA
ncbi:DUF5518 domain-containing protein [Halobium salinum]|uniref:DUF5518 domain-containing protein n=1 Tax=Halobium salinum TaxID=1364940 RepID=A0ABD5PD25_9EURY|nr:DUF5518 domain-containing protein [Halobium salinum]